MTNSQQKKNQKVQDDTYSNLNPKQKPNDPNPDRISNPATEPESFPGHNPSQFPDRNADPNEIPNRKNM